MTRCSFEEVAAEEVTPGTLVTMLYFPAVCAPAGRHGFYVCVSASSYTDPGVGTRYVRLAFLGDSGLECSDWGPRWSVRVL